MKHRTHIVIAASLGALVGAAAVTAVFFIMQPFTRVMVVDFDTCVLENNVVMESYPRMCRDARTGILYVEEVEQPVVPIQDTTFLSPKNVSITLDDWNPAAEFTSPLTLTGTVPGSWSFEASFPVVLTDWDGRIIAEAPAVLQGGWMTDDQMPFEVTLTFDQPRLYKTGALILQRSNPSGLAENDDAVEIAIQYQ